ncbi:hypothetical protein ABPG72_017188 [Tetrahymena utriculariae]
MNGDQIKYLTEDQIFTEYYNFTKQQKFIVVKTQNFNRGLISKVVFKLIKYDKTIKITTLQQYYFILSKDQKSIRLLIKQNWFAQGCLDILNHLRPFCLNIQIQFKPEIENLISNFIYQNFDLIPFLQIRLSDNQSMELINEIKAETLKLIVFNKTQAIKMTVNPEQVYYDLLDS